jgi:hypothetical protein
MEVSDQLQVRAPLFQRRDTPIRNEDYRNDGLEALHKENVIWSCRDSNGDSRFNIPTSLPRLLREKCKAAFLKLFSSGDHFY